MKKPTYRQLNFFRKFLGALFVLILFCYRKEKLRKPAILLILSGLLTRFWAAGTISKNRELARSGPYSLTRNPLYFGSFMMGFGFSVLLLPVSLILGFCIAFSCAYLPKMRQEESDLRRFFGSDFENYSNQVPLFFPKIHSYAKSKFSLKLAVRNKEYNAFLAILLLLAVIFLGRKRFI
ncbi:MAG: isoprenylcysteine carboxylmethyltransferase family protein [Candidatus Wallbacteria bacterium]|nr:isoprenylcysteine carboxylmethyltransferase family protein [Candidatus Wallbacteria bacterium]